MQRVSLGQAQGKRLAKPLFWENILLYGEGMLLSQSVLEKLSALGENSVFVYDEDELKEQTGSVLSESEKLAEQKKVTEQVVSKLEELYYYTTNLPLEERDELILGILFSSYLDEVVNSIQENKILHLDICELKKHDSYTYCHSVNVAVLSLLLGNALDYNKADLKSLTMASLLHDIGKLYIPSSIINKKGSLTQDEFKEIMKHPFNGAMFIKRNFPNIDSRITQAIYQHHEKMNGSGYPRGCKGDEISNFARIITICDIYDALVSKRSYHDEHLPSEAIEYLYGAVAQGLLDFDMVNIFTHVVQAYPSGAYLQLSNREIAVVTEPNFDNICRPTIRIVNGINTGKIINMLTNRLYRNVVIVDVLKDYQQKL